MFRHASRFVRCACLCGLAVCGPAGAKDAAPAGAKDAAPAAAAGAAAVPTAQPAEPARRLLHPQVAMAGFQREYRPLWLFDDDTTAKIRAVLDKPVDASIKFRGSSLRAALSLVHDVHCIPVIIDERSLADSGIDVDGCTIEQEAAGGSLGATLRCLLRPFGLTWTIADEAVTVLTEEKAQEKMVLLAYPVPRDCADNGPMDFQTLIDLIQSTVAAATWDTVGGAGAIRPFDAAGLIVVSQTLEVHNEVEELLRAIHTRFLAEFAGGRPVLRVHHVADAAARTSLAESLKGVCNASLTDGRDEQAAVTTIGDSVAVVSKSPEFHALAAQVVAAVAGVEWQAGGGPFGMKPAMQGPVNNAFFCWVAREVYGARDPRWLVFRGWMTTEAPHWLHDAYAACGPGVADWLRGRPAARAALRRLMDVVVEPRLTGAAVEGGPALP